MERRIYIHPLPFYSNSKIYSPHMINGSFSLVFFYFIMGCSFYRFLLKRNVSQNNCKDYNYGHELFNLPARDDYF